jgi:hypothetical protein
VPRQIDDLVAPVKRDRKPDIVLDSALAQRWLGSYLDYCGYEGILPADDANCGLPLTWPSNTHRSEYGSSGDSAADQAKPRQQTN